MSLVKYLSRKKGGMNMENKNLSRDTGAGETREEKAAKVVAKKTAKERPAGNLAGKRPEEPPFAHERAQFLALLLSNPNYFGNLKASPFKSKLSIKMNTTYEEIGCVGFQSQFDRLQAVVYIKEPWGYGGEVCFPGTPEYVRFYISSDNGAIWKDLGLTSFTANDIPEGTTGSERLEYAVTLEISPEKKICFKENLSLVRAILSWNVPPPPNEPDFVPVWGDIHNTYIQIASRRSMIVGDLFETLEIKPAPQLLEAFDLTGQVKAAEPKTLTVAELYELYKDKKVEPHRFAMTELQKLIAQPVLNQTLMAPGGKGLLPGLNIDWSEIGNLLSPSDGSVRYEELECIGLDPNMDTLVGVIRVKLPYGYCGGLCFAGSKEYVTFWADFDNNGSFETCLGTTSVDVHDISRITKEGLEYAVYLPVDLSKYRKPCKAGPVVVRIRAILSWQVAPPCFNPKYVPVWGNRLETRIHIKAGASVQPGTHYPIIQTVGSMDGGDIDPITGLANGPAALAGFTAHDSPFGGVAIITGHLGNAPDISNGAAKLKYRVEVSDDGGLHWQPVTNSFKLERDQLLNGIWSDLPDIIQSVDADGWYEYQEDLTNGPGNAMILPVGNVLASWNASGLSGLWKLRIRATDPAIPGSDWTSNVVTVMLDDAAPNAAITITSGGGPCADFTIGDVISGTYSATDQHFGGLSLSVVPAMGGSFTSPAPLPAGATMPLARTYAGGVPTTGEAGNWSLNTTGMPKCGYVIYLHVGDRTILNSGSVGRHSSAVVGLCLRKPGA